MPGIVERGEKSPRRSFSGGGQGRDEREIPREGRGDLFADGKAARVKHAREALAIDPEAIDAYVILALSTESLGEQIALLREAVRIGKAHWSEAIRRPSQHDFWLDIKTRPFTRAVHNLALTLWERGEQDEAARLADFLLKLNPNDNQGIRFLARDWHEALGNRAAVERLLKRYGNETRTFVETPAS